MLLCNKGVFAIKGIRSPRRESAQTLVTKLDCDAFSGKDQLETLIKRSDIDAFIVALPLDVQPNLVIRLLRAGKHVLSEKPISPTVAEAKKLLDEYQTILKQYPSLIWSVGENFRYEPGIRKAASLVRHNKIGDVIMMNLTVKNPFLSDNPYLNTAWRKEPSWDGGLFIDAFIHAVAGVRLLIPGETKADHLPSPDMRVCHVTSTSGVVGSIVASYATTEFKYKFEIAGKGGTMLLQCSTTRPWYNLIVTKGMGKLETTK